MKKIALGCTLLLLGSQAFASDGEIKFTGEISSTTCTINGGTKDINVALPKVAAAALTNVADKAGHTKFSIALTNCTPASGSVTTYFESGPNIDAETGNLKNTDLSGAANVQLGLENMDQTRIDLSKASGSQGAEVVAIDTAGNATLSYNAFYVATGAVTPGPVTSSVMYSMDYQ